MLLNSEKFQGFSYLETYDKEIRYFFIYLSCVLSVKLNGWKVTLNSESNDLHSIDHGRDFELPYVMQITLYLYLEKAR